MNNNKTNTPEEIEASEEFGFSQDGFDAIEEGQVVATKGDAALSLIDLETLIKNTLSTIEREEGEYKKFRESLEDIFANDETYQNQVKAAKEAVQVKSNTKKQIMKMPAAADLAIKIKELKEELTERKDALSEYLGQYQSQSGLTSIEDNDGIVRDIVMNMRLVKRTVSKPEGK